MNPKTGKNINFSHHKKICRLCDSSFCQSGAYLEFETKPGRQVWICRICIEKGDSSIVRYNVREGKLKPWDFVTGDAEHGCDLRCPDKRREACPTGIETADMRQKLHKILGLVQDR